MYNKAIHSEKAVATRLFSGDCGVMCIRNRMLKAIKISVMVLALGACATTIQKPAAIGEATMRSDGSIVMNLRAESESGTVGDSQFVYKPSDPEYQNIIQHLGGISKGETKLVPPWGNDR